ncbi:hypothetical protein HAX54_045399, partial [Datura stramonium]|nr:hypothetical protein [Datura stramonium]
IEGCGIVVGQSSGGKSRGWSTTKCGNVGDDHKIRDYPHIEWSDMARPTRFVVGSSAPTKPTKPGWEYFSKAVISRLHSLGLVLIWDSLDFKACVLGGHDDELDDPLESNVEIRHDLRVVPACLSLYDIMIVLSVGLSSSDYAQMRVVLKVSEFEL